MTERTSVESALRRGVDALVATERAGCFEGEMRWCPMLTAQYVLLHRLLGRTIDPVRSRRALLHFERSRLADGTYGLHDHATSSLYVTTLVYVASRLLGAPANTPWLAESRALFVREPVERIPTWGRVWLAMLGLHRWEGIMPMPPELWALPSGLPIHPSHYYPHTRMIYLALSLLRSDEPTLAPVGTLALVRDELYPGRPFTTIDFRAARGHVSALDLVASMPAPLARMLDVIGVVRGAVPRFVRARVARDLRARIRLELQSTDHLGISPVSGMLGMLALHAHDPHDPTIEPTLASLETWVFEDEREGFRVTGARSQTWDTAFALQALAAAAPFETRITTLRRGARWLASQQIRTRFEGWERAHRTDPSGGFCFAHREHGWPVSDCTAEAIVAMSQVEDPGIDGQVFDEAIRFVLRCQNHDGGFGSYEPKRGRVSLEFMNPSEMFLECMTESSYVECTASSLMALVDWRERFGPAPRREPVGARASAVRDLAVRVETAIARARAFLESIQRDDGAFGAAWGIHFVYGTMFALRALAASGSAPDSPAIRRAVDFLVAHQRDDGGWGEHESGAFVGHYVDLGASHPVQTSWALLALAESGVPGAHDAMHRAAAYLARTIGDDGAWESPRMIGCFFRTALVDYTLYRFYFPVWGLGAYLRATVGIERPLADSTPARTRLGTTDVPTDSATSATATAFTAATSSRVPPRGPRVSRRTNHGNAA